MTKRTKKKNLGVVGKLVLSFHIVAVILLLISYLSPFVDPQIFWPIAFLSLAYIPLLFINFIFAVIWMFRKGKRVYALFSISAILIGLGPLQSHIGWHWPNQKQVVSGTSPNDIRVLTYNVHLFRGFDQRGTEPEIKEQALAVINDLAPDVVCLQEYYSRQKGKHNISGELRKELGLHHQYFHPTAQNEYESYGLAIFSKYPIVSSGHLPDFEQGVNSIIYADIEKEGRIIRIYNVHLRSYGFQQEDYDFITGPTDETMERRLTSTRRIGGRLKRAFALRSMQAQSLRKHLENNETPFLILGDFNDTPLSFAVNHVGKGLKNTFREKGWGLGKTYNGDFPNFQIDFIWASPDFDVKSYQIVKKKLSDHYPVWADLVLN